MSMDCTKVFVIWNAVTNGRKTNLWVNFAKELFFQPIILFFVVIFRKWHHHKTSINSWTIKFIICIITVNNFWQFVSVMVWLFQSFSSFKEKKMTRCEYLHVDKKFSVKIYYLHRQEYCLLNTEEWRWCFMKTVCTTFVLHERLLQVGGKHVRFCEKMFYQIIITPHL